MKSPSLFSGITVPECAPLIAITGSTVLVIAVSALALLYGWLTIFQNLFYFPIILSCIYYLKRGFVFSVLLAGIYFGMMVTITRDLDVLEGAFIRVLLFILVAAVITYLSLQRVRAEEALRKANRQLNLMTSITRHDINNKLTAVFGFIDMAEMKVPDPTVQGYLREIDRAANEIRSQIEFTKVYQDLGTHEPRWQEPDGILPRSHVPAGVTLTADLHGIEMFADPMLERAFFNLLDNSLRHGERVTEIRVSSRPLGDRLSLVWEDNGVGIPAEMKEACFERGVGRNTGLGLFLVREILSLTGMTIKETGEPGKGARFEITVPKGAWRSGNVQP
jgi:signal transduction histidine kinase